MKTSSITPSLLAKKGHFVVDDSIGVALSIALAYKENGGQYLIVASNLYKAQRIFNYLSSFLNKDDVLLFPSDELIRAETLAQSKEMVAHRLYVMNEILKGNGRVIVANIAAVCRYLPDPIVFSNKTLDFKIGGHYEISELKRRLIKNGYSLVSKIDQSLQFAVRGDILDIFSVNNDHPIRIEFFDNEIESIRFFDIATQQSIEKIDKVTVLPASDILLNDEDLSKAADKIFDVLEKDKTHMSLGDFELLRDNVEIDITNIIAGLFDERVYKYYSLITNKHFSLFDYCPTFTRVFVDDMAIEQANKLLQEDSFNYLEELHSNYKITSHLEMYQDIHRIASINPRQAIVTSQLITSSDDTTFSVKNVPFQASKEKDAFNIIQNYLTENYEIVICLNNSQHINVLEEGLSELGIKYEPVHDFGLPKASHIGISALNFSGGFVLPEQKIVYLTGSELFNEKVRVARFDNRFKEGTILKSYEDLEPGDYVVHEYQGIGQFLELQTLEVDGVHKDYLKIAYNGGELLYVPLAQFQLVRKYLGKEGATPRLSRLHTKDWENQKKRIKERVNELAERLMNLYIERSKIKGFAFQKDDEFQLEFEKAFPYNLTSDQAKAIREIKEDMEKDCPMDRLLCGDVGFGKTEVAFQAAFKAIDSGKQVAILCPTTLLARQHYELALERFSAFEIKIAVFSRLIPEKQQQKYIEEIKQGKIHLIIGTHRLLSKDIEYNDLGLLIVDEEQRFGVEQKEKIKELKSNIDVLTLSATPIPRTLQISLLGVRALSRIDTAPQERMPIQTYVTPFNIDICKELIERELGRNGQVFFLHNNVSTLYQRAAKLQRMLPGVTIGVAHGQMHRDDIEDVMMKFYRGEIQVLVCTSIVENGIDVPNANMIIVESSENYGLSQLYQIKGRVGRSNRIAYAYLMYSENKVLKEKAQKRLKAIQEFTELGSGYKIAQRDLMIRGAGDILGPEQAGFIDSIGLDMYIKLLNEAVKEKMTGVSHEEELENSANINLSVEAYIPSSFASDADKIELYQEILSSPTSEELAKIKIKTRDVFGKLPQEVETLFKKRNIDLLKEEAQVETLVEKTKTIEITLGNSFINIKGIGNILFEALIPYLQVVKVSYANKVFKLLINKRQNWLSDLENILKSLSNIKNTNRIIEVV